MQKAWTVYSKAALLGFLVEHRCPREGSTMDRVTMSTSNANPEVLPAQRMPPEAKSVSADSPDVGRVDRCWQTQAPRRVGRLCSRRDRTTEGRDSYEAVCVQFESVRHVCEVVGRLECAQVEKDATARGPGDSHAPLPSLVQLKANSASNSTSLPRSIRQSRLPREISERPRCRSFRRTITFCRSPFGHRRSLPNARSEWRTTLPRHPGYLQPTLR